MYKKIREHPSVLQIYSEKLIGEGVVTEGEVAKMRGDGAPARRRIRGGARLQAEQGRLARWPLDRLEAASETRIARRGNTGVRSKRCAHRQEAHGGSAGFPGPQDDPAFPRQSREGDETGERIDWATAEALAFGSLLQEGHPVRLSGQEASAARSRNGTRCCTTRRPRSVHATSTISVKGRRASKCSNSSSVGRGGAWL